MSEITTLREDLPPTKISSEELLALARRLFERLGLSFSPSAPKQDTEYKTSSWGIPNYHTITTTTWSDGALRIVTREDIDRDHEKGSGYEDWRFFAEIQGLPGGTRLRFEPAQTDLEFRLGSYQLEGPRAELERVQGALREALLPKP